MPKNTEQQIKNESPLQIQRRSKNNNETYVKMIVFKQRPAIMGQLLARNCQGHLRDILMQWTRDGPPLKCSDTNGQTFVGAILPHIRLITK
jgi:hypothetical protein